MDEIKNGDYVQATFAGSHYYGTVSHISVQWQDATITVAPGVSMILPLSSMVTKEKGAGNGTYSI